MDLIHTYDIKHLLYQLLFKICISIDENYDTERERGRGRERGGGSSYKSEYQYYDIQRNTMKDNKPVYIYTTISFRWIFTHFIHFQCVSAKYMYVGASQCLFKRYCKIEMIQILHLNIPKHPIAQHFNIPKHPMQE